MIIRLKSTSTGNEIIKEVNADSGTMDELFSFFEEYTLTNKAGDFVDFVESLGYSVEDVDAVNYLI